jgi:hypothetical protein
VTAAEILARLEWGDDGLPVGRPGQQGVKSAGVEVLAWAATTLVQPDGDHAGDPWEWRSSQARFTDWWYALDEAGGYLWRRGQIVLMKGAGKSPTCAALACCELAGPVRFVRWKDNGDPLMTTHPSPEVKLSALSADQATDVTLSLAVNMLSNPEAVREIPGLDPGLTRIRTRRGTLTSATARAPSKEGLRPTAVILDETSFWVTSNGGHHLAESLRRGLAKTAGRSLEATNMWVNGSDSVAERTASYAEAVRAGTHAGDGVLTWHPVGHCDDLGDPVQLRAGLEELYADAPWISIDRLMAEIIDGGTHPSDARRFYLNQAGSSDDAWIRGDQWDACHDPDKSLAEGDTITLGFDGSRGRSRGNADACALVAVRVGDGFVSLLGCWQAREGQDDWQAPESLIDSKVREAFKKYRVLGMFADPSLWQSQLGVWEAAFSRRLRVKATADHPMHYWANRPSVMVRALAAFEEAVNNHDLSHDGSYSLSTHVRNARRTVTSRAGVQISKSYPDSPDKIDCAVAATLAWAARLDALAGGHQKYAGGKGRIIVLQ